MTTIRPEKFSAVQRLLSDESLWGLLQRSTAARIEFEADVFNDTLWREALLMERAILREIRRREAEGKPQDSPQTLEASS